MAKQMVEVEMWACLDNCGDYRLGVDADEARERYEEDVQPLADADGFRLVKVLVTVALPEVVELTGTVTDDEAPATLTVA